MKKFIKILIKTGLLLFLIVASYLFYIDLKFYRIDDKTDLSADIKNNSQVILDKNTEYTVLTSNFGFGAYSKNFSFFMDKGKMKNGSEVVGECSVALSKQDVLDSTAKEIALLKKIDSDFILLQEVDIDSTRSYHVNEYKMIVDELADYASCFDMNLHSPYFLYPITEPYGSANAGLVSFSKYRIDSAVHRKLYISEGHIEKQIDLDRCLTVLRIPVKDSNELVLINLHLSAYDEGGKSRAKQMEFINKIMAEEYQKGNYVILGGDFNHVLSNDYQELAAEQVRPKWLYDFPVDQLNANYRIVHAINANQCATCRTGVLPYKEGINYRSRIDGFIVSDNIEASSEIIDENFEYSDHNPVLLKFKFK